MRTFFTYITTKDKNEAKKIGKVLVEERLAACVNIVDGMTSMYWWNDEIQEDQETVLIAKTSKKKLNALKEKVKEIHSYDCPCVIYLPIEDGNRDYIDWIIKETTQV